MHATVLNVPNAKTLHVAARQLPSTSWLRHTVHIDNVRVPRSDSRGARVSLTEKHYAAHAQAFVASLVLHRQVTLSHVRYDATGEMHARVHVGGVDVRDALVGAGLGVVAVGGWDDAADDVVDWAALEGSR